MPSPWAKIALVLLLVASLGLKAWRLDAADQPGQQSDNSDMIAMLSADGFALAEGYGLEGDSWIASRGDCDIEITAVSALGWHQSAMVARAGGRPLLYVYAGQAFAEQPELLTRLGYYWHKLSNYFYPSAPPPVFAIVTSSGCARQQVDTIALAQHLS